MPDYQLTTVTTYGRRAGSARVRVFDWIDWLGVSARSETYVDGVSNSASQLIRAPLKLALAEMRLRRLASSPPACSLLLSRQASPFSSGSIEERVLRASQYGVYDFDDALMYAPSSLPGGWWSKSKTWRRSVRAADQVIAGNSILASEASEMSNNVVMIPSCVDPGKYQQKGTWEIGEVPRAVWMGSPSTERYLEIIAAPLVRLNRTHGLRLTVVSAGNGRLGVLDPIVDRVEWTPERYAEELGRADFGIMPLEDSAWTRGKCAYKLLQYGAAALPVVGSPVGANENFLADAHGFAPIGDDEWFEAIEELLSESSASREARGKRARETVVKGYSYHAWSSVWKRAVQIGDYR
ncbi:Glycosyl transferases group 1 [Paramicrobacterium humi]|uniref:Glycosyl transferases group 1 n=1 Tax=Paramicrobacterium humi TaxID=640635 RepID=A0A1H4NDR9_9MICO|nr:glycosyltransferase [Microbacterium humi]SEB93490.1 Glycosyl transferases group 1 [Microbacterium humi]